MDFTGEVTVSGMPDIRTDMADPDPVVMRKSLIESFRQEGKGDYPTDVLGIKTYPVLAISGSGAYSAYSAGFLKGWSGSGTRPLFKIITGVSSGTIISFYAFLGQDYDRDLEKFFTSISTKDIMTQKSIPGILLSDSLMSSAPLVKRIAEVVNEDSIARVAAEHRRGRRLFFGTVNLDSQQFIVWDMGAIACKGTPESLELFRKVALASSSMPMTFPPVHFKVTSASGEVYDEMHVDGATMRDIFYIDQLTKNMEGAAKVFGADPSKYKPRLYIINSCHSRPDKKRIQDNLFSVVGGSLDAISSAQNNGDMYRLYANAKRRHLDFNLAVIPDDFKFHSKEEFDKPEMRRLFDRGYEDAIHGYRWYKTPPGYAAEDD